MAYTTIKLKRAAQTSAFSSYVSAGNLQRGELVIDYQAELLYVGKGGTEYLTFLSADASEAPHALDGGKHDVAGKRKGQSIRITSSDGNNFAIERLGYYDLGHISNNVSTPTDPTGVNFTGSTHTIGDSTGLSNEFSRWHFMHSEHVAVNARSIFATQAGSDTVNMTHSGLSGVTNGYRVREIRYDTTQLPDSVSNVMVLGTLNNTLSFRRLTTSDISGYSSGPTTITGLTGTARSIFYTQNSTSVINLSYDIGTTERPPVLLRSGTSALQFRMLAAGDLPGESVITATEPQNNDSLRYNSATNKWVNSSYIKILNDHSSALSSENITGIIIDNYTSDVNDTTSKDKTVSLHLRRYDKDPSGVYPNTAVTLPNGNFSIWFPNVNRRSDGDYTGSIRNEYLNINKGIVFSNQSEINNDYDNMLFYSSRNWTGAVYPQLQLHKFGTVSVFSNPVNNAGISSSSNANFNNSLEGHLISNSYRDFIIRSYNPSSPSNSIHYIRKSPIFENYSIFEIESRTLALASNALSSTTNSQRHYSVIKINDINFHSSGTVNYQNIPELSLLYASSIYGGNDTNGIHIDNIQSRRGSGIGLSIDFIAASNNQSTNSKQTISAGISIGMIANNYVGVTTIRRSYGIKIGSIFSEDTANAGSQSYGMDIESITGRTSVGLNIQSMTAYDSAIGIKLTDLNSTSNKTIGLYINPSSQESIVLPSTDKYNIYSKNGRHYFEGLVDVVNNELKITRSNDDHVALMIPKGRIDITGAVNTNSIRIVNGNITLSNGFVKQKLISYTYNSSAYSTSTSRIVIPDFSNINLLIINKPDSIVNMGTPNYGIYGFPEGYVGQTLYVTFDSTSFSHYMTIFDNRITSGSQPNIRFRGGIGYSGADANRYLHIHKGDYLLFLYHNSRWNLITDTNNSNYA